MDMLSFLMGLTSGGTKVELSGTITCTDDGEGNVTITTEEVDSNGD